MFEMVEGMPQQPGACVHCGNNPLDDDSHRPMRAIFSSGVDINWGDSVYTCWNCAELIADLVDREPRASYDNLKNSYDILKGQYEELSETNEHNEELLEAVRNGTRAQKEIRTKSREPEPATA